MAQNSGVNLRKSLLHCLSKLRECGPSLKDAVHLLLSLSKLRECVLALSGSRTVVALNDTMPAWWSEVRLVTEVGAITDFLNDTSERGSRSCDWAHGPQLWKGKPQTPGDHWGSGVLIDSAVKLGNGGLMHVVCNSFHWRVQLPVPLPSEGTTHLTDGESSHIPFPVRWFSCLSTSFLRRVWVRDKFHEFLRFHLWDYPTWQDFTILPNLVLDGTAACGVTAE